MAATTWVLCASCTGLPWTSATGGLRSAGSQQTDDCTAAMSRELRPDPNEASAMVKQICSHGPSFGQLPCGSMKSLSCATMCL